MWPTLAQKSQLWQHRDMLLDELKSLLQSHNLWAKKKLGQNFLVDEEALEKIIQAAELEKSDNVVEVGPGTGFLTERLIQSVQKVVAVEYDPDMVTVLEGKFARVDNLEIIRSDILKFNPPRRIKFDYKVVANIPYYITSPLLKHFLQSDHRPSLMVILVQKEVAEKIVGLTGKSMVTMQTQVFGKPEIIAFVPANSFYPAPKVDSAILKINVYDQPLVPEDQLKDFFRLVGFGFSQKRKKLANTLSAGLRLDVGKVRDILKKAGIDPNLRAENLEVEDWKKLLTFIPT